MKKKDTRKVMKTPADKKAEKQEQNKKYTVLAIVAIALTAVLAIAAISWWPISDAIEANRQKKEAEAKAAADTANLIGCWYAQDSDVCWKFSANNEAARYNKSKETGAYVLDRTLHYSLHVSDGMLVLYYDNEDSISFDYVVSPTVLTLGMGGEATTFNKGDDLP